MQITKMRTSWRKREAAGTTLAEERATREDEEMEPVLDAGEVRTREEEQKEGRGGMILLNLR